jgi:protein-disulfide isomerase
MTIMISRLPLTAAVLAGALGMLAAPAPAQQPSGPAAAPAQGTQTSPAKPVHHRVAHRPRHRAAQPALTKEQIEQIVRTEFAKNQAGLRAAIVDLLKNDADIRQALTAAARAGQPQIASPAAPATPAPTPEQAAIEKIVRDYLVNHPEVLEEASAELDKRKQVAEAEKARTAIKNHSDALFNSPRQVTVGNGSGDVTLVEFFDYNCGYCKRALADLTTIMKDDGKLRVVLKEFPVLGPGSVEAARVAVAVRMQDKGKKYFDFHQRLLNGRGQADKARALAAAKDAGFDIARIEKDMTSDEVKVSLEESLKLAEALGLNGTPSYVVGDEVVVGAVGLDALKQKVNLARCGKTSCS